MTTELPKLEDWVEVTFRGRVTYVDPHVEGQGDELIELVCEGGVISFYANEPTSLRVISKPLQVGDEIVWGEGPEPPIGSLLLRADGVALRRIYPDGWVQIGLDGKDRWWGEPWTRNPGRINPDFRGGWAEFTITWLPQQS